MTTNRVFINGPVGIMLDKEKMFKVLFRRNTHDATTGEYRTELDIFNQKPLFHGLGSHSLRSDKWTSLDEYIEENVKYHEQFENDPMGACGPCPPVPALLEDLALMINLSLAEVKIEID